jgi:hypothetical protein
MMLKGGSSSPLLDAKTNAPSAPKWHGPAERPIHLVIQLEALRYPIQNGAMLYRGFPSKLHHEVPHWVEIGALFHIRIAIDREEDQRPLTTTPLAQALLDSARFYETKGRWYITLFLLMPDHLHALLSFASDDLMSKIVGDWKHFQSRKHGITWQEGYFDHRLRDDERGQ